MDSAAETRIPTPRERYTERRSAVEEYFLSHNLGSKEVRIGQGRIEVLSSIFRVPEELRSSNPDPNLERVTIFLPGMFEAKKPNYGNHPLEIKLAAALLKGDVDRLMVLKGEGLNKEAYSEGGQGFGQRRVGEACMQVLKDQFPPLSQGRRYEFTIVGHSEGATQGVSIAKQILDAGLGQISEFVAISGAGLVGAEDQNSVDIFKTLKENAAHTKNPQKPRIPYTDEKGVTQYVKREGADDVSISRDLIYKKLDLVNQTGGGLEVSLGKARVDLSADIYNVGKWGLRALSAKIFGSLGVPLERLRALWTRNPDYESLARAQVPMKIFLGENDEKFPYAQARQTIDVLRKNNPGARIMTVSADVDHSFSHQNPSGVAYALAVISSRTTAGSRLAK